MHESLNHPSTVLEVLLQLMLIAIDIYSKDMVKYWSLCCKYQEVFAVSINCNISTYKQRQWMVQILAQSNVTLKVNYHHHQKHLNHVFLVALYSQKKKKWHDIVIEKEKTTLTNHFANKVTVPALSKTPYQVRHHTIL